MLCKYRSEVQPRTVHEGLEREYRDSCTLSLTSTLVGINATPWPL
jgi:hypothetical protein